MRKTLKNLGIFTGTVLLGGCAAVGVHQVIVNPTARWVAGTWAFFITLFLIWWSRLHKDRWVHDTLDEIHSLPEAEDSRHE